MNPNEPPAALWRSSMDNVPEEVKLEEIPEEWRDLYRSQVQDANHPIEERRRAWGLAADVMKVISELAATRQKLEAANAALREQVAKVKASARII